MLEDLVFKIKERRPNLFTILSCVLLLAIFLAYYFVIKDDTLLGKVIGSKVDDLGQNTTPSANETTVTKNEAEKIYCEITGAVNEPGMCSLDSGSRVFDLLNCGKGFSKFANHTWIAQNLNMSQKIKDECKVYVPFTWDSIQEPSKVAHFMNIDETNVKVVSNSTPDKKPTESYKSTQAISITPIPANSTPSTPINVNNCSKDALLSLKGIGNIYATRIIDNRPYIDIEELKTKAKLSESLVSSIKSLITF
ncbi:helix-hairpin-helix domain-containing protein [candidate division WWE3 bacterium]|nr:helix-hairpin-helix domain-containing protein [candidate division WWE3 bacterium]